MKILVKNVYEKLKKEPLSSVFLLMGLILSFLIISVAVSFLTELMRANAKKKEYSPPNANMLSISMETLDKPFELGYLESIFEKTVKDTGIVINNMQMTLDKGDINTVYSVSVEWFNNDETWHYPLVDGRYYTVEEINNRQNVVLIGTELKKFTKNENGKDYISIKGINYEVIGIVGVENEMSFWDNRIFMPISCLPVQYYENIRNGNFSCVIYNEEDVVSDNVSLLKNAFEKDYDNVNVVDLGEIQLEDIAGTMASNPDNILIVAILGYIVSIVYAINIVSFWIEKRKFEMGVRKAFGYSNIAIAKIIFNEMVGISSWACVIGLIVQFLLKIFVKNLANYNLQIYLSNILVSVAMVIITALFTSIWPLCKVMKIQPIESIK